ncbi:MAG: hypothetical protein HC804_02170, partial [Anaerolineae bacterium]|nr:hypothetical protein [Anaerolineae bacterium]
MNLVTEDVGVDYTGVGFEADVLFCTVYNASGGSFSAFTLGFATNDRAGTVVQRAGFQRGRDNRTTTDNVAGVQDDAVMVVGANSSVGIYADVSAFDADGFTATPRNTGTGNPGSNELGYLALRFGSTPVVSSKVYTFSTPTSTGDNTDTGAGFEPQAIFYATTLVTTINTPDTGSGSGAVGVAVITDGAQYHNTVASQDGVTTTNTQSLSDNQAINLPLHDGAAGMAATYSTFTSTGVTLNWSDVEGSARLFGALAIGA